jgi:hypothetical protein
VQGIENEVQKGKDSLEKVIELLSSSSSSSIFLREPRRKK